MKSIKEVLAANLRKYRQLKGYTQEKLAELSDKSLSFIGDVENARTAPSLKTLQILADILNVEPYQLLLPVEIQQSDYYEQFFQKLRNEMRPGLFKLIEGYLNKK